MVYEETTDCDDLRSAEGLSAERKDIMAQKVRPEDVTVEHIKSTDLMFVDVAQPGKDAKITTVDVGEMLGFPGQILARVDFENEILYGLTIQHATNFKRKILWHYRMASFRRALALMLASIRTGLCVEEGRPEHMHALRGA
jgi:hypothetical protein